jgi:hypothetical protein
LSFDLHFFSLPVPFDAPSLSPRRAAKLGELVQRYGGPTTPDEHGFFFDLPDGSGHVEFYAGTREGAMLALRGLSNAHLAFAWDVMREMGWAVLVPVDDEKQLLISPAPADDLGMLSEMETETVVRVADSPLDLEQAITDPFSSWAAWRDQIGEPH